MGSKVPIMGPKSEVIDDSCLREYAKENRKEILEKAKKIAIRRRVINVGVLISELALGGLLTKEAYEKEVREGIIVNNNETIEDTTIHNQDEKQSFEVHEESSINRSENVNEEKNIYDYIYISYDVADNYNGYVDMVNRPNGDVIAQIPAGSILFVCENTPSNCGDGWKLAIYKINEIGEYMEGYVDTSVLVSKDDFTRTIAMKCGECKDYIAEYKPYVVNTDKLNVRSSPSTKYENVIYKYENGNLVYAHTDSQLSSYDMEHEWYQTMCYDTEKHKIVTGYIAGEYLLEKQNIWGYEDVNITAEDIKKIIAYKNSWENQALYNYMTGYSTDYNNPYVNNFVTQDNQNYVCQGDIGLENGAKNYGFGVMVNQNGNPNYQVVEYFKLFGYDVTNPELLVLGHSQIPVAVVDYVSEMYIRETIDTIKNCLQNRDVKFSKQEILSLVGICYQFGRDEKFVNRFIDFYIQCGGNNECFKNSFVTEGGTYPLLSVKGGNDANFGYNRGQANWKAFHDGDFIMGAGPVAVVRFDDVPETQNALQVEYENTYVPQGKEDAEEERY